MTEPSTRTRAAGVTLVDYLAASVRARHGHVAVEDMSNGAITYGELHALSDRVRDHLYHAGVRPGDRVGVYARKSIDAYAAMLGAMKVGAAYVPVDVDAPAWRCAFILADCDVRAVVLERSVVEGWRAENSSLGELAGGPALIVLEATGSGQGLARALDARGAVPPAPACTPDPDDLAYILYTSGSTGKPKGVMLSHRAAVAFVEWCSTTFTPRADDRFSSHAPFHFDLSILDLYVPLKHGATV
ncbi:MAG: AMP-binding protein, partial [Gemmatimonadaceae bacterium]|nr:AMP-binding protein [Gemmatimonadaceae bacterium]